MCSASLTRVSQAVVDSIHAFFVCYSDGFNQCSAKDIARLYAYPALSIHKQGQIVFSTAQSLQKSLALLLRHYREIGFTGCHFKIQDILESGDQFVTVTVFWTLERGSSLPEMTFRTTYTLRSDVTQKKPSWFITTIIAMESACE